MTTRRPPRTLQPSCEMLETRDLPTIGMGLVAIAWTVYQSSPVAALRTVALGCNLGKLAWTGRAKFACGLILVAQPFPLGSLKQMRMRTLRRHRSHGEPMPTKAVAELQVSVGPITVGPSQVMKVIVRRQSQKQRAKSVS